jgi:hypothetical protein
MLVVIVALALHKGPNPFVETNMGRRLLGLEALAEDGDPGPENEAPGTVDGVIEHGVAAVPTGASEPGPAIPGSACSFTIETAENTRLSFAAVYVQSNDLFFGPGPEGVTLFGDNMAMSGDVTNEVVLYDAGTERNETPGSGPNQAPRQSVSDTGPIKDRMVRPVAEVMDVFMCPPVGSTIRVTIREAS